ncbi:hypothetical protein Cs308_0129 [Candidatus Chlamydia sanziniae]|uniref:Lipoprotein n=1 Tax=Candidatus Chlamydia sanziniae TaxID=1806891 RepID=A0A1A9HTH9_9CHLA|nr:hypothetical protein Cs308_0129 [Candidatus Chlamydia sanziniae]
MSLLKKNAIFTILFLVKCSTSLFLLSGEVKQFKELFYDTNE